MELTVALDALLERLPGLRLDPDAPQPQIVGSIFRSPDALPVRFGA
jgi:cytochrome P450